MTGRRPSTSADSVGDVTGSGGRAPSLSEVVALTTAYRENWKLLKEIRADIAAISGILHEVVRDRGPRILEAKHRGTIEERREIILGTLIRNRGSNHEGNQG